MSLWEYKVISSGKGGFVSPALMEKFLNDLGKDEWEIVSFQTQPDNLLAFTGLARRSTQRDWTLQDAAAAAAKAEADKLRQEFEAKFKSATSTHVVAEEKGESAIAEKAAPDDGLRRLVDTSRDDDPDAGDDSEGDEWDKLTSTAEEELPTFFEAIRPFLRRNQRGPGMSVGVDYLAKKWDQTEDDLKGALVECGFTLPDNEDSKAEYVEYDGDLFWLNINRRGELWLNTKEKPRAVFRAVTAQKVIVEDPKDNPPATNEAPAAKPVFEPQARGGRRETKSEITDSVPSIKPESSGVQSATPLPPGSELLAKIRPLMRRNRRGPGGSGSTTFLARALKCSEADLMAGFAALGLQAGGAGEKPKPVGIEGDVWWLNQDSRGGVWINGRERHANENLESAGATSESERESSAPPTITSAAHADIIVDEPGATSAPENLFDRIGAETTPPPMETTTEAAAPVATSKSSDILVRVRPQLQATKSGSVAGKLERVAGDMGQGTEDFLALLVSRGLHVPEKSKDKPVFLENAGEIFWLNRNAKGELWLNAKASKFSQGSGDAGEKKAKRPARAKKPTESVSSE